MRAILALASRVHPQMTQMNAEKEGSFLGASIAKRGNVRLSY